MFGARLNWLQSYAVQVWQETPVDLDMAQQLLERLAPKGEQLIVLQLDEVWPFVSKKTNKCWI